MYAAVFSYSLDVQSLRAASPAAREKARMTRESIQNPYIAGIVMALRKTGVYF